MGALAYEVRRITSIRSTWILVVIAALVPGILTLLLVWAGGSMAGPGSEGRVGEFGASAAIVLITAAVLCTIGAAAIGQEYRHGLIRVTLALMPRRNEVMAAKLVVLAVTIAVAALVSVLVALLGERVGAALAGVGVSLETDVAIRLVTAVLFVLLFALFAFALTALTRSQPLGILVPILLVAIIEPILATIANVLEWGWAQWVLPFSGAASAIGVPGVDGWAHFGVLALWIAALLIPAWVLFIRRDA